jgi:hypothetical protein
MKRILLAIGLICLLLSAAKPVRLARFTIVNKAGMPIAVQLEGQDQEQFYYLRLPSGDPETPAIQTFTLVPDTYSLQVYYLELWDPVYGASCNEAPATSLELNRNIQMVFKACGVTPRRPGEIPLLKFGSVRLRGR